MTVQELNTQQQPACGDCEQQPCRCNLSTPDDLDLAWLHNLADHDPIQGVKQ